MAQLLLLLTLIALFVLGAVGEKHGLVPIKINNVKYRCKCSPADNCWPDNKAWNSLNASVDGLLIPHLPPAAVCYDEFRGTLTYNEAACGEAKANWRSLDWQISRPASAVWTWASNNTCELTDDPSSTCTMGNYPEYVIMAKNKKHIKEGIDFARSRNIRLVIRNTGHDFESRSSGAGSLAINTHGLKNIEFFRRYRGPGDYDGPAVKIGAGVQGSELLKAANAQKPPRTVITGECGTVGVAGAYIQGGGHGPLSSKYGFAADNALSFEIIDSKGKYVTADAHTNRDLFWALKGGGPGNFAAVLSVTLRTFPDNLPTAGVYLNVNASTGADYPQVLQAVNVFHEHANYLVEKGLYAVYELHPPQTLGALRILPIMGFNMTGAELSAILKPLFDGLNEYYIPYDSGTLEYPDYYSIYRDLFPPEPAGLNALTGGWVFSRKDLRPENQEAVADAIQTSLFPRPGLASIILGHLFDPRLTLKESRSSTNTRWEGSTIRIMAVLRQALNATWDQKVEMSNVMAHDITEKFREVAPNGMAYVNEAYPFMENWQETLWGDNYPKLKAIKKRWDPKGVFYSPATPGAEEWHLVDYAHRLCKKD